MTTPCTTWDGAESCRRADSVLPSGYASGMPFPPELLSADEKVAVDLRPHWWFIAPAGAALAGALLIGLIVWINKGDNVAWDTLSFLVGLGVLVALGYFGVRYAKWSTTNFVVTNERVISRTGVISKQGIEIPLDRINTVFFDQSLFLRMVGAGDLGIESAGEGGRQTFDNIRRPNQVQQEIYRQKEGHEEQKLHKLSKAVAQPQAAPQPSASIPEQIEQLDQLRRSGAITNDEYEAKKADLLRRL